MNEKRTFRDENENDLGIKKTLTTWGRLVMMYGHIKIGI